MEKITINPKTVFVHPMPMVIVGSMVNDTPNFMAVGWVSRVNMKPPLFSVAIGPHHTIQGIEAHKEFSINIPDVSLMEKTDYCGLVSGSKVDKSKIFDIFYGELKNAPLIRECPVSISLTVFQTISLPYNTLYIGQPREVFTEERYMTGNSLDIKKINPFTLTMPDNNYWAIGENLGNAWSMGRSYTSDTKQPETSGEDLE